MIRWSSLAATLNFFPVINVFLMFCISDIFMLEIGASPMQFSCPLLRVV